MEGLIGYMGYDRAITIFSPEGELLQVEYALRAVKQGPLAIGMRVRDGIILLRERRTFSKLEVIDGNYMIFRITDRICAAFSGFYGDGRYLVKQAIVEAQRYRYTYGEDIDVKGVAEEIADIVQLYTHYAGTRPFGASIIFAGIDKTGKKIFLVEPTGTCTEYKAVAIGRGQEEARKILEDRYKEDINIEDAIKLGIEIFKEIFTKQKEKFSIDKLELAIITKEGIERYWGEKIKEKFGI